ncbi:MAG: SMP-30/gluconolactonase/LRE family protein, partial [Gammaproteobacteria bacterium]
QNGDMLSLTSERRFYRHSDRDTEAMFLNCLPATFNVQDIKAFYIDSSGKAHFVVNHFDEEKNRNQLWLHSTGGGQDEEVKSRKLAKARNIDRITAGAYDQLNASYYLASGNRVYKLDSDRRLKFVTEVDGARNILLMKFLDSSRDLLLLDDLGGNLYRLSMTDNQPRVQKLASGLARPISMIADAAGQQIYVGESLQPRIKRFTCDATGCGTGVDLVTGGALQLPTSLALGKRDELWVADPESNAILVYDEAGQLMEKIDERPSLH